MANDNLRIYEKVRAVPENAQKPITAGRLKGFTDINAMWRIKKLTDLFGPCGVGWWYSIDKLWIEEGANNEKCAMALISLTYKDPETGELAIPIPGIGGNMLVAQERNGLYTSDEAYKKAVTDAISVACKALGIGADIYWDRDESKYPTTKAKDEAAPKKQPKAASTPPSAPVCEACGAGIEPTPNAKTGKLMTADEVAQIAIRHAGRVLCPACLKKLLTREVQQP